MTISINAQTLTGFIYSASVVDEPRESKSMSWAQEAYLNIIILGFTLFIKWFAPLPDVPKMMDEAEYLAWKRKKRSQDYLKFQSQYPEICKVLSGETGFGIKVLLGFLAKINSYYCAMDEKAKAFESEYAQMGNRTIVIDNPHPRFMEFIEQKEADRREIMERASKGLKPDNKDYGIAHSISIN